MFNNLSLKIRIFFLVSAVVIVSFVTLTIVVSSKSAAMAKKDAFNLAEETADKYKNQITAELQGARITSETLASVFESLKDNNITDRDTMNDILKNTLSKKEYITAFCIAYDPNALDGKDEQYAGKKPAYDDTGRYTPYWNKLGGKIAVEPLYDVDIGDWYIVPKNERHEYITDPYPYEVQGHTVMLASMVFPILHKGNFIGIIASDFVLDKLQEMVSKVTPHEQEGYTEIFSNAGAIVAHPDKPLLGKDIFEALAYEMLTADRSKINEAVKYADEYAAGSPVPDEADEEKIKAYNNNKQFVADLKKYAGNRDGKLDLSLMNPEMARAMLKADPVRSKYAAAAKDAINNGREYVSSGREFYTVYMPIRFSSVTKPWSVAVSIPMTKILDNANDIRNYGVVVSAIAICVIACILYLIARSVTRPILILSDTAKILGEGNFGTEVPLLKSNDEIGALSRAFKFMAEKIEALIGEMQKYAKTLEEKNVHLNKLNEELEDAVAASTAAAKAKGLFLSNMSHEIRTPLNAVIGLTNLLLKTPMDDAQRDYAEKMRRSSMTLLSLVNDILDFSKMDAGDIKLERVSFDIRRMFGDLSVSLREQNENPDIALRVELDPSLPAALLGDPLRLQQIFINLADNAYKFTEKGSVTIRAAVSAREANDITLDFAVEDTGIGMNPKQMEEIFAAFNQADNSSTRKYGGLGIGLAITRYMVKLMGGKIAVSSEEGKGTVFSFSCSFQLAGETSSTEEQADAGADNGDPNAVLKGMRVLLVEDNEINLMIAEELLNAVEIEVTTAENGKEALERIAASAKALGSPPFDLVLMDMQMPVMDGYEATKIIRSMPEYDNMPVFALTAHAFPEEKERCLALGMGDHLTKPIDVESFYGTLRKVAMGGPAKRQ